MTARDEWSQKLRCLICGAEGVARLSEEDGWSYANGDQETSVDFLSEGFKVARDQNRKPASVSICCVTCDVPVL
jgi:hypothetical protein